MDGVSLLHGKNDPKLAEHGAPPWGLAGWGRWKWDERGIQECDCGEETSGVRAGVGGWWRREGE